MHRLVWTTGGLWMLALLFLLNNDRCTAFDFKLHHRPTTPAHGFINHTVSSAELAGTVTFAEVHTQRMQRLESSISQSRIQLRRDSTSFALLLDSLPDERAKQQDRQAQVVLKASVQLLNHYCLGRNGLTETECARDIETVPLPAAALATCQSNTNNGTGDPHIFRRLLPAVYDDGLQRMGHAHAAPLPKTISDGLFADPPQRDGHSQHAEDDEPVDEVRNNAVVQWAQFVEHDLAKTVFRTMDNGVPIECCDDSFRNAAPRYRHPACAPLAVESKASHISCLNYVRSALGVTAKCTFGPAQQYNQATGHLDLSQLYGHGEPLASSLRRFSDGALLDATHVLHDGSVAVTLPEAPAADALCMRRNATGDSGVDAYTTCYKSGDSRCNANPLVTPLYTLFLRSHNRYARAIRMRHPRWTDERIFQRARQLNVAIYTRIVYDEWLPVVVGNTMAAEIRAQSEAADGLNAADVAVSNEWATAAARFYYSMMPGALRLGGDIAAAIEANEVGMPPVPEQVLDLQREFYSPRNLAKDNMLQRIMDAILKQKAMAMDTTYVDDVSQYLFRISPDQEIGTDVLALDIQRGRDHGLAAYTKYVELCTGRPLTDWDQLRQRMSAATVERLRTVYRHLHKIDLVVGGVAETPARGATVGPTFACLIGEQFARTWRSAARAVYHQEASGDRDDGASFLCDNGGLDAVPRNIFHVVSDSNPLVKC